MGILKTNIVASVLLSDIPMRVHLFRLTDWQEAKSPKKVKKTFLQNCFPGKFGLSEGQIDIMLAKKNTIFL